MIDDDDLDELITDIERGESEDAPRPSPRRREIVGCRKWRGMWIVVKRWHRPGHAWDGLYVAQAGCGLFETKKPKVTIDQAVAGAVQHITTMHVNSRQCPEGGQ